MRFCGRARRGVEGGTRDFWEGKGGEVRRCWIIVNCSMTFYQYCNRGFGFKWWDFLRKVLVVIFPPLYLSLYESTGLWSNWN